MIPLIIAGSLLMLAGCVMYIWNSCEVTDPDERRAAALRMYSNAED